MKNTTIAISEKTKEYLEMLGRKSQTYDDIIQDLIEIAEKSDFFEKQKTILNTERFIEIEHI